MNALAILIVGILANSGATITDLQFSDPVTIEECLKQASAINEQITGDGALAGACIPVIGKTEADVTTPPK